MPDTKLAPDKKKHIAVLFCITFAAALVTKDALKAIIIAVIIGFGKEVYDIIFGGVASIEDMSANFIGIFLGIMLFLTIIKLKEATTP